MRSHVLLRSAVRIPPHSGRSPHCPSPGHAAGEDIVVACRRQQGIERLFGEEGQLLRADARDRVQILLAALIGHAYASFPAPPARTGSVEALKQLAPRGMGRVGVSGRSMRLPIRRRAVEQGLSPRRGGPAPRPACGRAANRRWRRASSFPPPRRRRAPRRRSMVSGGLRKGEGGARRAASAACSWAVNRRAAARDPFAEAELARFGRALLAMILTSSAKYHSPSSADRGLRLFDDRRDDLLFGGEQRTPAGQLGGRFGSSRRCRRQAGFQPGLRWQGRPPAGGPLRGSRPPRRAPGRAAGLPGCRRRPRFGQ